MKTKILITIILFTVSSKLFAYDSLLFKPLIANHLEARIGTFYQSNTEKLRLDIGHSLDMYEFISTDNLQIRAGGDFFILSRLRSEGKMKFPVETADYYFGLNCTGNFKTELFSSLFENTSFRLRAGHISSHLVDGYTFLRDDTTLFLQEPFVYSREFLDLIFAFDIAGVLRPYWGLTYIFSTLPKDVQKIVPQTGADFQIPIMEKINLVGGYDLKLHTAKRGSRDYAYRRGNNSFQLGALFDLWRNVGISLNYYYYNGYSIHGMFFNQKEKYKGFGIQIHY
jgi:hypothetical protein